MNIVLASVRKPPWHDLQLAAVSIGEPPARPPGGVPAAPAVRKGNRATGTARRRIGTTGAWFIARRTGSPCEGAIIPGRRPNAQIKWEAGRDAFTSGRV